MLMPGCLVASSFEFSLSTGGIVKLETFANPMRPAKLSVIRIDLGVLLKITKTEARIFRRS